VKDISLPNDQTAVSLPSEATETKCVVKDGEMVKVGRHSYIMPDGSIRSTIKDCDLQVGSSMVIEYTENKQIQFVNTKPRKKTYEAVAIPFPLPDPSSTPTSVEAYVAENIVKSHSATNKYNSVDPIAAFLLAAAAIITIAIALVISFINAKAAKVKKLTKAKIDNLKKKQQDQNKCNSKSDNVKSLIKEVDMIIDNSFINNLSIEQNVEFSKKVSDLNKEIASLNKKLNKIEDELTKIKVIKKN
jgi:hypothetical protein